MGAFGEHRALLAPHLVGKDRIALLKKYTNSGIVITVPMVGPRSVENHYRLYMSFRNHSNLWASRIYTCHKTPWSVRATGMYILRRASFPSL